GKLATDLMASDSHPVNVIEQQRAMTEKFMSDVEKCIENNESHYGPIFFVNALTKKEPTLTNVVRTYFVATHLCPYPTWDQTIFLVDTRAGYINYMWTIPDRDTCNYLY